MIGRRDFTTPDGIRSILASLATGYPTRSPQCDAPICECREPLHFCRRFEYWQDGICTIRPCTKEDVERIAGATPVTYLSQDETEITTCDRTRWEKRPSAQGRKKTPKQDGRELPLPMDTSTRKAREYDRVVRWVKRECQGVIQQADVLEKWARKRGGLPETESERLCVLRDGAIAALYGEDHDDSVLVEWLVERVKEAKPWMG